MENEQIRKEVDYSRSQGNWKINRILIGEEEEFTLRILLVFQEPNPHIFPIYGSPLFYFKHSTLNIPTPKTPN